MNPSRIPVVERIMGANEQLAAQNREMLDAHNVHALNIMAAPGAGKVLLPNRLTAYKAAGTAYVAGAGEDLAVIHTGGAAIIAIDSASFLDSALDEFRLGERVPVNPETLDLYFWTILKACSTSSLVLEAYFRSPPSE